MNEFDKTNEQDVSKGNNRRSFLKKSATGAVVFSLPAKSVWGACSVSGAMSGNLSTNVDRHDCTMPVMEHGCKPYKWQDLKKYTPDIFSHLKNKKSSLSGRNYRKLRKKYIAACDAEKAGNLHLPHELIAVSPTCGDALASSDPMFVNLGCVYMNACFGLYPGYAGPVQAAQLANDVFLYMYTNSALGRAVSSSDSDFGFTDSHASNAMVLY